jgi:hypothetical protein
MNMNPAIALDRPGRERLTDVGPAAINHHRLRNPAPAREGAPGIAVTKPKVRTMRLKKSGFALAALSVAALSMSTASEARNAFDGRWTVQVVAKVDWCSDNYAVSLRVDNGRVSYGGAFGAVASGKVAEDGRIVVRVAGGGDVVNASGALKATRGNGQWRSPNCKGIWTAQKV